jgi:uncharacterized protein YodC (DUF2158 family)
MKKVLDPKARERKNRLARERRAAKKSTLTPEQEKFLERMAPRRGDEAPPAPPLAFKAGDCVELRSGGPTMTVMITDERTTNCLWFEHTGNVFGPGVHHFEFPTSSLYKVGGR